MLLPPLCLLGLSLVYPGVVVFVSLLFDGNFTDLGCRLRLRLLHKHLRNNIRELCVDCFLWINGEMDNDSSCFFGEVCVRNHLEIVEQSNLDWRLISEAHVMTSSIMGIPEAEEARGYALTTMSKTKRLEG
ncbi:hypothetical protein F2Q70_00031177 [Brassica cretica]|uniref:Uncharacterized protein n=1 Tax=Brassica cretica TaxID=69181 RepID=A0A8S9FED9_BRACR|nr:hypothetical protein F2Q70_00031177 [Brassica cretica]KAF3525034.1 hypothetical protein F2Q69_00046784 [Brassica cretica]